MIPDKVKAAGKMQAEKKAEKASTAATAIAEDEIVLNIIDSEKSNIELSSFNMNDTFNKIPTDEDIVYLKTMLKESNDEESNDGDDVESNDKSGNDNDNDPPSLDLSLREVQMSLQMQHSQLELISWSLRRFGLLTQAPQVMSLSIQKVVESTIRQMFGHTDLQVKPFNLTVRWISW